MRTRQSFPCFDEASSKKSSRLPAPHFGANYTTRSEHVQYPSPIPCSSGPMHIRPRDSPTINVVGRLPGIIKKTLSTAMQNKGPTPQCTQKKRVKNPGHNDVLYGRGGAINNHMGNIYFRSLVNDRKEEYNSYTSKANKTKISREIIRLIKVSKGIFLEKEKVNSANRGKSELTGWWVEVDVDKAMSKTSQALREGAPYLRAARGTNSAQAEGTISPTSIRRKRSSESRDHLVYKVSDDDCAHNEQNLPCVKKSRLIDVAVKCDEDHSVQENAPTVRVETKQEEIAAKDTVDTNAAACGKKTDLQENEKVTAEGTHDPAFCIEEPIAHPSASNLIEEFMYPSISTPWCDSYLEFSYGNLDTKSSFTNLFKNEEELFNVPSLDTSNVSLQQNNCDLSTYEDCEKINEGSILTMPLLNLSIPNNQELLYLENESNFE